MGKICIDLSDGLEKQLRLKTVEVFGGKKGDLSKFIERAVRKEVFRATLDDIRKRNADLSDEEIQALVDEEVAAVRKEFWRDRKWWDE